jgi:hypothetical protein
VHTATLFACNRGSKAGGSGARFCATPQALAHRICITRMVA